MPLRRVPGQATNPQIVAGGHPPRRRDAVLSIQSWPEPARRDLPTGPSPASASAWLLAIGRLRPSPLRDWYLRIGFAFAMRITAPEQNVSVCLDARSMYPGFSDLVLQRIALRCALERTMSPSLSKRLGKSSRVLGKNTCARTDPNPYSEADRSTRINSLSLRAKTDRLAKAGWLHTTLRPQAPLVGSKMCCRPSSR